MNSNQINTEIEASQSELEWALSIARNEYFTLLDYHPKEVERIEFLKIRIKTLEKACKG